MKKWIGLLRVLGFLLLFLVVFSLTTKVLIKKEHKNNAVEYFYKEPRESLDVVFVGTSHAYHSFSPMELWEQEGISSYNIGTSSQPIPVSYYLCKDIIRRQHPDVIVLEVHGVKYDADYFSTARVHVAVDGMPLNPTKIELFRDYLTRTMSFREILDFAFPISLYHSRWNDLEKRDFRPPHPFTKGYFINASQQEIEVPEILYENAPWEDIHDSIRIYIDKIITLCEENDVNLVFCQAPMGNDEDYESIQMKVNTIMDYAKDRGVDCINFQRMWDEIDLDFSADYVNEGHLNVYGAKKISTYLAGYLKEKYALTDHRDDPAYASWDADYEKYAKQVEKDCKSEKKETVENVE